MAKQESVSSIKHGSHEHPLELASSLQGLAGVVCLCCGELPRGRTYACKPCRFFLHGHCAKTPELIEHPFHPQHPLVLAFSPACQCGSRQCDGCGHVVTGFTYGCRRCDVDLHVSCAAKPLSVAHSAHPCELMLRWAAPYKCGSFSCDVCRCSDPNHLVSWVYRCAGCKFDAHVDCATAPFSEKQHKALAILDRGSKWVERLPQQSQPAVNSDNNSNSNVVSAKNVAGAAALGVVGGAGSAVGKNLAESLINAFGSMNF